MEIGGTTRRCSFALVSRVRNYGGDVDLARGASLLSERFEVLVFEGRSVLRFPLYFLAILTGMSSRMKGLTILPATEATATPRPGETVHMQVDGEYAGPIPASFEIVPSAIRLLVPESFKG